MYRVKFGSSNGSSASQGDWRYYEEKDEDRMVADLMAAYLQQRADHRNGNRYPWLVRRLSGLFLRHLGKEVEAPTWRLDSVHEVAIFIGNEEWEKVEVIFHEPSVEIQRTVEMSDDTPFETGLDRVRDAVKAARGGEAPPTPPQTLA